MTQVEKLEDPVLPVAEIVAKCPAQQLMAQYRIPAFADADEFLQVRLQFLSIFIRWLACLLTYGADVSGLQAQGD